MNPFPAVIYRVTEPSKLDEAPLGTICKVGDGQWYIQSSPQEGIPDWHVCFDEQDAYVMRNNLLNH